MAEGETAIETPTEDPVAKIKAEWEAERNSFQEERRKLNKLTTEAQQELAETKRFLHKVLPKVNKVIEQEETFADSWEKSPEVAVETRAAKVMAPVEEKLNSVEERLARQEHEQARLALQTKYPDYAELEGKIAELSNQDPMMAKWSWTKDGLEKLYKIVKSDRLEAKVKELETSSKTEREKSRAFSETAGEPASTNGKKEISREQKRIMKEYGLTPEQWEKYSMEGVEDAAQEI